MKKKYIAAAAITLMSIAGSSTVLAGEVTGGPIPKDTGMREHANSVLRARGEPDLPGPVRQREAGAAHADPALPDDRVRPVIRAARYAWRRLQPVAGLTRGWVGDPAPAQPISARFG